MFEKINLDDLHQRLSHVLPPGLGEDVEKNGRLFLQAALEKMNLVTREEFEVQRAVLVKTREKVEKLEGQLAELERRILNS